MLSREEGNENEVMKSKISIRKSFFKNFNEKHILYVLYYNVALNPQKRFCLVNHFHFFSCIYDVVIKLTIVREACCILLLYIIIFIHKRKSTTTSATTIYRHMN